MRTKFYDYGDLLVKINTHQLENFKRSLKFTHAKLNIFKVSGKQKV